MNGYDFIYHLERNKINEMAKATRGISKTTTGASYNRLAYNVFRSLYPPRMEIFKAANMGFLDTARHHTDFLQSQRKRGQKLSKEDEQDERQKILSKLKDPGLDPAEREKIESSAENIAANKASSQLARKIWVRVTDYVAKHEEEGITSDIVQSWILDPDNEVGQEILSKIKGPGGVAQIVGINGEPVTGWTKELWSGQSDETGDQPIESEKEKSKTSVYNEPEKQKVVGAYKGRSKIPEENRKFFTSFIKKVIRQAHESGILKTISIRQKGQGGRATGQDTSAYEFAAIQAIKPVIHAIAYNFADIATRALIEFELIHAEPDFTPDWSQFKTEADEPDTDFNLIDPDDPAPAIKRNMDIKNIDSPIYKGLKPIDKKDLASYANQIFSKIQDQMQLSGIKLLPATIKNMSKKWIRMASENLERAGFDKHLGKELEYYKNRLNKTPEGETFKMSAITKKVIEDTTGDIANDLFQNTEFINTVTNFIIDTEEVKKILRELDPTVREREAEIAKIAKRRTRPKKQSRFTRVQQRQSPMIRTPLPEPPPTSGVGESFRQYINK